ncbi:ATP-binding protein [Streptomyces sp. ISL-66]|uniref:ATP-binding protein n=1 Tax=Streptomyces sp. ISL-66 TaxID=2819186 RepID=UPI001BEAAA17|nr:ATP-binding protein [Streptomyces sp. ISL-66]MBT2470553.1 ATP-binding protein [Streptomyces sp. ISL-66]
MIAPVLERYLPRVNEAAAAAREATRAFLDQAGQARPPAGSRSADDAVLLVVGELVSNAIRHTDGPCTLRLALRGDGVDIRVTDTSPHPPEPRAPHTEGSGGWGWLVVNHLATDLHIEPAPGGGKTICARVPW